MKPTKSTSSILTVSAIPFIVLAGSLQAATIANFSFEANVNPNIEGRFAFGESRDFNPDGTVGTPDVGGANNIVGWTTATTEGANPDGAEISVGFINIAPADGDQVLAMQSGASTSQFTSTAWSSLSVGDEITMTVAIGDRNVGTLNWADESFFALIDGLTDGTLAEGTLLGSTVADSGLLTTPFAGGLGTDGGTMQDRSFTYTVQLADLSRSGNVGVLLAAYGSTDGTDGLGSGANQAFFDNVRLAIIPEPSAALLGGLGVLCLLRRRRN